MSTITTMYTRALDAGNCTQRLIARDGIIIFQDLVARTGHYTGDGNPELVGRPVTALRGMGFRRTRAPRAVQARYEFETYLLDTAGV